MFYSEIVPDDVQEELISIRDSISDSMWRIGDITNALIVVHKSTQTDLGTMAIYSAVGLFVGKAGRTVREYASIAKFFAPHTRMEYEVLSFDHFRVAMRFGSIWRRVLEWAIGDGADLYGRPASVDAILAKFATSQEVGDDFLFDFRTKASDFLTCLNPLLSTPLRDKTMLLKSQVVDLLEEAETVLNKAI